MTGGEILHRGCSLDKFLFIPAETSGKGGFRNHELGVLNL